LPHAERTALKHHERRVKLVQQKKAAPMPVKVTRAQKRVHAVKVAALAAHEQRLRAQQRQAKAKKPARKPILAAKRATAHKQKLAAQSAAHTRKVAQIQAAQAARAAKLQSKHQAALDRHQQILAQRQAAHQAAVRSQLAAHQARVANQQAAYAARLHAHQRVLAQKALENQTRLAKQQAAHNARLAEQRAHWVALHGDGSGGRSIRFWQTVAAGVPVKVITVDLNDDNVKVSAVMALRGNGTSEPFRRMIERANPNVAVTGTFFSMDNLHPIGDIVIDGSLVHFGGMGTALCVTPDNRAQMVTCVWGRHHDWSPYDFVVACGPRLLQRGRIVLDPRAERFRDQHMLAPNSRIAVGITEGNKLVFAMTKKPIYLGRLAKLMRSLGTTEAMNLDAGTSTGFYYNGATLARPGRNLTNMIVVYGRKDRYERALDQLVPSPYRRTSRTVRRQLSQVVRP
nr:phosphodiester glycosidase family protein [Armatimonadota bacterium]